MAREIPNDGGRRILDGSPAMRDPHADLEASLIREHILKSGGDPTDVLTKTDARSLRLKALAVKHAAGVLANVETRSRYVQDLGRK
jgi:hypothetical protein